MTAQPADVPRRRNKALATWRRTRAVELRLEGKSHDEIARQIGIRNRGTVHRMIAKALEAREVEDVAMYRAIEVARLNRAQLAIWDRVEAGDVKAIQTFARISKQRCQLLGLYDGKGPWDEVGPRQPTTVVVGPAG